MAKFIEGTITIKYSQLVRDDQPTVELLLADEFFSNLETKVTEMLGKEFTVEAYN